MFFVALMVLIVKDKILYVTQVFFVRLLIRLEPDEHYIIINDLVYKFFCGFCPLLL